MNQDKDQKIKDKYEVLPSWQVDLEKFKVSTDHCINDPDIHPVLLPGNRKLIQDFIADRVEDIFSARELFIETTIRLNGEVSSPKSEVVKIDGQPLEFFVGVLDSLNVDVVLSGGMSLNGKLYGTIEFMQMMSMLRHFNPFAYIPQYDPVLLKDINKEFLTSVYGGRTVRGIGNKESLFGYVDSLQNYPCTLSQEMLELVHTEGDPLGFIK